MTDQAQVTLTPEKIQTYVTQQLSQGVSRDDIIRGLVRQGVDTPTAIRTCNDIQTAQKRTPQVQVPPSPPMAMQSQAVHPQSRPTAETGSRLNGTVISGLVIMGIGIVLTVGGYMMASSNPHGGQYFIFWGLILVGLVRVIRGLFRS